MKRKLIKQGENALTVTIPKEWTQMRKLRAGDEVDLDVHDDCIIVHAQKEIHDKKTSIHFPAANSAVYRFFLANAYRKGFDEVEITFDEQKQLAEIQGFLEELMGVEITQQVNNKIIVRCVALPDVREYETLLRRTFHIIQTGFSYLVEDSQRRAFDPQKMNSLQKNLLRLSNFCTRVLHQVPAEDKSRTYADYVILKIHDYAISQLRRLYTRVSTSQKVSKQFIDYTKELHVFFSEISNSIFKNDVNTMITLLEKKHVLFERKDYLIRNARSEAELIQDASILFRLITMYLGPLSIITFREKKEL